jgi:benzoyl-CoA reductase/2-hydroxyglutaryl-CoA dehydratase subunit BcrC/BadD/HgdB
MQLTEDLLKKWEDLVDQVDKDHIPIECVKKIVFRIEEGRQKTINIQKLKKQGIDVEDIHNIVDRYVQDNCDEITNMEFVLDIEEVAKLLQPETDNLLKNL